MVETACAEDSVPLRLRQWYHAFLAVVAFTPSHRFLQAGHAVLSLPCVRNSTTILARCLLLGVWAIISQSSICHCRDVSDASFQFGSKHTALCPNLSEEVGSCSHGKMYFIFFWGPDLAGKQEVSGMLNQDALVPPPNPKP